MTAERTIPWTAAPYLSLPGAAGNYASTPDSAAHTVTGDIDIRVKAAADDWTHASAIQTLVAKRAGQCAFQLRIAQTTGRIDLVWSADGTTLLTTSSTVAPTVDDGAAIWLRVTFDVDNGSAQRVSKFYTSDDYNPQTEAGTWTQLGATNTIAGATSIFDSNALLEVGAIFAGASQYFAGKIYYAEVRNGIDGTIVATFDPARAHPDGLAVGAETGELWTIHQSGATPAEIVTAPLEDPVVYPALIYEGEFITAAGATEYLRLWSGLGTLTWNGETWLGEGQLLGVSQIEETTEVKAVGFTVSLAGQKSSNISLALNSAQRSRGRSGKVWLAFFDAAGAMRDDPLLLKRGKLDRMPIEDEGEKCTLTAHYEDRLIDLKRARIRRYTDQDQKAAYPADRGFEQVAALQDMQINWGRR